MLIFIGGIAVILMFIGWAICAAGGREDDWWEERRRSIYDEMKQ